MKNINPFSRSAFRWSIPVFMMGLLIVSSCSKTESNKPAPTVNVDPATTSNVAGAVVSTSVQVDAAEGGASLTVLVNGASGSLGNQTLDGSASQTLDLEFTIPANATIGATYLITFQAVDKKGQQSGIGTFAVTVSGTPPKPIVEIEAGNITTDQHWTSDNIYKLMGYVRVGTDTQTSAGVEPLVSATATLTIDAGTVIYGKTAVGGVGGVLIIQRGSKIIANGTSTNPVVFTSEKAVGTKKSGDWGGLVICGLATNNTKGSLATGTDGIEQLEGGYGGFHGGGAAPNDADDSGTLTYVRIEYAGYPINPNQEINGLTLGSVGSGTTLSYIQVTYANDDSFEWFGGAVNADHLIAYKGLDDDFDTDNGFSGKVQFGLGIRDASIADQSGSNGFESDNDAAGSTNTPVTSAQFSNMTIVGGKQTSGTTLHIQFQNGAQIRRNTEQDIFNSIITAYPNGLFIDSNLPATVPPGQGGTITKANAGTVEFKHNILAGVDGWGGNGFGSKSTTDEKAAGTVTVAAGAPAYPYGTDVKHPNNPIGLIVAGGAGAFTNGVFAYANVLTAVEQQINGTSPVLWFKSQNLIQSRWDDTGLDASIFEPLNGAPTLVPTGGSPLTLGAGFTGLTGFQVVGYRGAFGNSDWTTGWVNWNPAITDYSH